jgi:hypothetical protein
MVSECRWHDVVGVLPADTNMSFAGDGGEASRGKEVFNNDQNKYAMRDNCDSE